MASYKCIFFDLDHTLWDYDRNCAETLAELHERFELPTRGIPSPEVLLETFLRINTELWDLHDRGLLHKDAIRYQRFHKVLMELGIDDYDLSLKLSADYIAESPRRGNLMPHAKETLEYLSAAYPLFIITNGFDEIQGTKVTSSGIQNYFRRIITSEMAGHKKPSRGIFDYALQQNGFQSHEAIMIGDNLLTDIAGARNAGVDHVFFNPGKRAHAEDVTYEIHALAELKDIL